MKSTNLGKICVMTRSEPGSQTDSPSQLSLAERIAELLDSAGLHVAVAESLTGGMVASALAKASGSSTWFRGGVVAYASDVKHQLLNVPPGPVVSPRAAAAMADGVRGLLKADVAVALTGAGGPDGQDGQPPGTVFLALSDGVETKVEHCHFAPEDPAKVCAEAVVETLRLLHTHLCHSRSGSLHHPPRFPVTTHRSGPITAMSPGAPTPTPRQVKAP